MKRKQFIMMTIGMIGVFGIQVGLYELIKGNSHPLIVYTILAIGSVFALKGFGAYRKMEDEQRE